MFILTDIVIAGTIKIINDYVNYVDGLGVLLKNV